MPSVFLSPSLQEYNPYVNGGNEEYYMNLIADEMVPILTSSGIEVGRNSPEQTLSQAIAQSNAGNYNLHLAIHSNAAPPSNAGNVKGADIYYSAASSQGTRAATIFANNYKLVYPYPELVKTIPTTSLAEIVRTRAPAILIEVGYHDNPEEAQWIRDNISAIAENLSASVTDFLGVLEEEPTAPRQGRVTTQNTALNIRNQPSTSAQVIGQAPRGAILTILGTEGSWYLITYNGLQGYVNSNFVTLI
ncbi:MAG: SH3 domain-containing protein [Candidatus Pseudoruminococcus sp.]|nr:SH3 domain-containing protein [Ruminococcus sp.]MDY2782905.1 SH3 domain-containing protein [Candidatus Pseudoruminococcus sp.]